MDVSVFNPHGLIMKINNTPTELSDDLIKNDRLFWDWNCKRLLNEKNSLGILLQENRFQNYVVQLQIYMKQENFIRRQN